MAIICCDPYSRVMSTHHSVGERRASAARRLCDIVRLEINRGRYADVPMPSDIELAQRHGVSRNTVREAYALLQSDGLIERVPGAGTFALARKGSFRFDRIENAPFWGSPHRIVATRRSIPAVSIIADELGIAEGDPVVLVERITIRVGERWAVWTSYFREELIARADQLGTDLSNAHDVVMAWSPQAEGRAKVNLEAIACDADVAGLLEIPVGSPLLLMQQTLYADDVPIEYAFARMRGDRVALSMCHSSVVADDSALPSDIIVSA